MNDFDFYGWKDFVSIYVNNGHITTVEYNAKNASGFIRSWDQDFMRAMNAVDFTYPNRYTREYVFALLNFQDLERIDVVSGATHSYHSFILLSQAVIEQARKGDNQIALVKMPLQRHQYENENN
ncbi:MAG: FMN-binding protein [Treponema sp.]|nr:FMN-binding protein [Treponema sp.]